MDYTLADAATAAGVNRSTVLRAIKNGRLSARRLDDKSYRVDASELARVFSMHKPLHIVPEAMPGHAQSAQGDAPVVELAELRVKVEVLERERETHLETVADLRKRLDQEQEERRSLQRLLAAPVRQTPEATEETPAMIRELHRRLDESEALIRTLVTEGLPAPQAAQDQPNEPPAGTTTAGPVRGFLGRLLGLGRGAPP